MKSKQNQKLNRAHWQKHVGQWKKSGQSKAAFCRQHELNPDNFGYYCRQLNTDQASVLDENNFIELKAVEQANKPIQPSIINFKLKAENGCTIEWSVDWSVDELKAFVAQWVSA